jgi:hypothetical protein
MRQTAGSGVCRQIQMRRVLVTLSSAVAFLRRSEPIGSPFEGRAGRARSHHHVPFDPPFFRATRNVVGVPWTSRRPRARGLRPGSGGGPRRVDLSLCSGPSQRAPCAGADALACRLSLALTGSRGCSHGVRSLTPRVDRVPGNRQTDDSQSLPMRARRTKTGSLVEEMTSPGPVSGPAPKSFALWRGDCFHGRTPRSRRIA